MPLAAGTRLGPYEIVAPLGAGGMGEVYRAKDSRLGRDVAIKVLPQHLSANPEVRARFEREAKTISSLNHPNICTLFDVGRAAGEAGSSDTDFLVMELLEGETLAQRLEKGALPTAEVLRIGGQIADALDRAHRAGVIHRDLKPGNVMLTRSGAKLMDFGLARATGLAASGGSGSRLATMTQSPTVAAPLTAEGMIVGTFQYMAPEQLEGKETDARGDLWALGCVLYEMATGVRPFTGESQASLIAAIMTGEPRRLTELQPVAPIELERVIQQCLQKDPEARCQSARDLKFMLELSAGSGSRAAVAATVTDDAPKARGMRWWLPALGLLLLGAGFGIGRLTAPQSVTGSIRVSTLSQGTRDGEPAVSPDGRLVAFSSVRENGQGLWLMDMSTRGEVKLTNENDHLPRFTPDGGSILFTRVASGRPSLWRIPVIGGAPRLVIDGGYDADPAPDGQHIVFISGSDDSTGSRSKLMVAKSDGTGEEEIWSVASAILGTPRWSSDGKRVALGIAGGQNAPNRIVVVDVKSRRPREYPAPNLAVLSSPLWDGDGKGLIVAEGVGVTAVQRGSPGRLFRLDVGSGRYTALGWLENFPLFIDMMHDGRLVLAGPIARENLREVSLGARNLSESRQLTSGMAIDRQPVYSPNGKSIMFSSNRGGTLDLWEVSVETGEMHRITDDPADDWDPEYTPDGQSIVWCSGRSGAFEIWMARRDGSAPRQLSRDSLDAENPSVSPDQKWVIYSSSNPAKYGMWRMPITGGDGENLLRTGTLIPDLSADGRYVSVITGLGTLDTRLSIFDLEHDRLLPGAIPLQATSGTVQIGRSRFMADGRSVAYISARENGQPVLLRRSIANWGTGPDDTLFARAPEAIESFGFSPDGTRAAVAVVDWLSSLLIAEGVHGVTPPKRRQ